MPAPTLTNPQPLKNFLMRLVTEYLAEYYPNDGKKHWRFFHHQEGESRARKIQAFLEEHANNPKAIMILLYAIITNTGNHSILCRKIRHDILTAPIFTGALQRAFLTKLDQLQASNPRPQCVYIYTPSYPISLSDTELRQLALQHVIYNAIFPNNVSLSLSEQYNNRHEFQSIIGKIQKILNNSKTTLAGDSAFEDWLASIIGQFRTIPSTPAGRLPAAAPMATISC